jgi:adenylate kinase
MRATTGVIVVSLLCWSPTLRADGGAPVLVLIGAPGAGKSTQAKKLSQAHSLPVVSTGELLRAEVARGSALGRAVAERMARGELVPDAMVDRLVAARIAEPACAHGFILDGYPRNARQMRTLTRLLSRRGFATPSVLYLDVSEDVLLDRLGERGREDDEDMVVQRRMADERAERRRLTAELQRASDYHVIAAGRSPGEVFCAIESALSSRPICTRGGDAPCSRCDTAR